MAIARDQNKMIEAEKAITQGALCDLKLLLDEIKGRTLLVSNSVSPRSPIQKHLDGIIARLNESMETTEFLSGAFEVDSLFQENQ